MAGPPRGMTSQRPHVVAPPVRVRHSAYVQQPGPPGQNWSNVADHVRRRRVELGLRSTRDLSRATNIGEKTLGRLEQGRSVRASTLAAVERVLDWRPGTMTALLAGGEPLLKAPPKVDDVASPRDARQRVLDATVAELVEIRAYIEGVYDSAVAARWFDDAMTLREESAQRSESAG